MANETLVEVFTGIADAIREKEGSSDTIPATDFASRISAIDTQEDLSDELYTQDVLISDIVSALSEKTAVPEVTPSIDFDEATGLITATAGDKSVTEQVQVYNGTHDVTPSDVNQQLPVNRRYLTNNITIKGDSNLKPENIVSGVSIFGVDGEAEIGGGSESQKTFVWVYNYNYTYPGIAFWYDLNTSAIKSASIAAGGTGISFYVPIGGSFCVYKGYADSVSIDSEYNNVSADLAMIGDGWTYYVTIKGAVNGIGAVVRIT